MKQVVAAIQIEQRIYFIRSHKVMLDVHLAALYNVATKNLSSAPSLRPYERCRISRKSPGSKSASPPATAARGISRDKTGSEARYFMTDDSVGICDKTYIHLVRETLLLAQEKITYMQTTCAPYNSNYPAQFYKVRATHLLAMSLIGLTAEHLLKLILAKRGQKIASLTKQGEHKWIGFHKVADLFMQFNSTDYYSGIVPYIMNPFPDEYNGDSCFAEKEIKPEKCVKFIKKIRDAYVHSAQSHGEQNGVIWYCYNFLVWLSQKEFNADFDDLPYIGSEDAKKIWQNK
ncbi:MAG: hypothetical protein FD189_1509 [Elusimicrobia bacterium]|nr:MAG: hypothetical protein FD154_1726 [Elusimicrobiota bacterium]KAF0155176.1 MAG: hypothetical protein FD189_1509 [Elusimicrobiota bacterium]